MPGIYPKSSGRSTLRTINGRLWYCSGTVVNSENKSVVWTPGHCVHDGRGGTYHTQYWMFAPAYKNGTTPLGKWTYKTLRTTSGWPTTVPGKAPTTMT